MYKITLKPRYNYLIFKDQTIYWYPVKVTPRGMLLSIGIASKGSIGAIEDFKNKGSLVLEQDCGESIYFIYFGDVSASRLFDKFPERPLVVEHDTLSYYFSEYEMHYLYEEYKYEELLALNIIKFPSEAYIEILSKLFSANFKKYWSIRLSKIDNHSLLKYPIKYHSTRIIPHPIIHLIDCIDQKKLSKEYYYKLIILLLEKGFLVEWEDIESIPEKLLSEILFESHILSANEIYNKSSLWEATRVIISELFSKFNIFMLTYLASQSGTNTNILKILMSKFYSIIPDNKKIESDLTYPKFQPKFTVESVELHFIHTSDDNTELIKIYEKLKEISLKVKFYDFVKHKIVEGESQIISSISQQNLTNRYRFICDIKPFQPIDYLDLKDEVLTISYAIKAILGKKHIIKEMWIKKIRLLIMTPPQFEDDLIISLWRSWFIKVQRTFFIDQNRTYKVVCVDLFCDYNVFSNDQFFFSLYYALDMQHVYSTLNKKLLLNHNFTQFS